MTELERLCERDKVTGEFAFGEASEPALWENPPAHNWRVTLRRKGHELVTDFYGGSAVTDPTPADVLACLCSDVTIHENDEYGELYEDAGQAIAAYKKMELLAPEIRSFLGDAFDEYANAEH